MSKKVMMFLFGSLQIAQDYGLLESEKLLKKMITQEVGRRSD